MMTEICGNCIYYIDNKTTNNCAKNIVGKVKPEQYGCYLIQFSNKLKINRKINNEK